jgi:transcriptional regulator with XRE-family HTH domain
MNQSNLIRAARRDNDVTLEALGEMFGCTRQRIYQVEAGVNTLPTERVQILATDSAAPEWARDLAFKLWLLNVMDDYAEMFAQLEKLRGLLFPNGNGKARK